MRKIYLLFIALVLIQVNSLAQGRIAEIWTDPAIITAHEPISIYFDVTGTQLDGETEGVYFWSWFPSEPDAGNYANSSDFAALTHVSGNIWRMDMVPDEYYGVDSSTITAFYGLLKNKDGTKKTDAFAPDQVPANDIKIYDLTTIKGNAIIDYYPKEFAKDRPLSILINANNTWSNCETTAEQGDLANAANIHAHSGVNNWAVQVQNNAENLSKTELTSMGGGIYRLDLIPADYYGLDDNFVIQNLNFVFADDSWAHKGNDVACADFLIIAPEIPEVIPPELTFFPQKISKKDILIVTRTNNEVGVSKLHYIITGGDVTIEGDFEGNASSMSAYIDLVTPFKETGEIEKINIVIKDNNNRVITDTDISLIQLAN